jgi:phospholipid/cholesterol/gamma-HCH transport system permease protein
VRSIGIVSLVSGSIGIILALQTSPSLATFGQIDKVANLIAVAVFRELGPLIAAIVLTGFAGASIAAEIGTMVVGEEIEALEAMALNPIRFLVVPRVVATTLSLILLSVLSDLMSVIMGGVAGVFFLDIPYELYKQNTIDQLKLSDFTTGLLKASVFGLILGLIACQNGIRVTGGAAGVGKATTSTVVQTVVSVVLADLLFTAIFYALGWN